MSELEAIRLTQSLAAEAAAEAATEWLMDGHGHGREFITIADLLHRPEWHRRAACRGFGSSSFFPVRGQSKNPAKAICDRCEVRTECLAVALPDPEIRGIWGGTSSPERIRIRGGRRSAVGDRWRDLGISVSQGARSRLGNAAKFPIRSRCHIQEAVLPAS